MPPPHRLDTDGPESDGPESPDGARVDADIPTTLDEVSRRLRELRVAAGNPSYSQIVRRVASLRAARGVPGPEQTPGRITVYDCFRDDRRRFDVDLVIDVARALGLDDARAQEWRHACWTLQHAVDASRIVSARSDLPDQPGRFVGRIDELESIVSGRVRRVVASGMAGCGKTRLACEAARMLVALGRSDHVVLADLRGFDPDRPPADPAAMQQAILRALGEASHALPADPDERHAAFVRTLAARRAVVILDDAGSAGQVDSLAVDHPDVTVIVTSRWAIGDDLGADRIALDVLSVDDSIAMMGDILGSTTGPAEEVSELVGLVGRLPLAIQVLGARVLNRPGWTIADHVASVVRADGQVRLDHAVADLLAQSYGTLSEPARGVLRLLATQPCSDVGVDGVAALASCSAAQAAGLTAELVAASMATETAAGRFALHALVKAFASERSLDEDRPGWRSDALAELVDHLVAGARSASEAMQLGIPPRTATKAEPIPVDTDAAVRWFAAETDNLLTAIGDTCTAVRPAIPVELSEALFGYLQRAGRHADALILHARAIEVARRLGDTVGEALAELHLGQNLSYVGDAASGLECLRRAEELLEDDPWIPAVVRVKNALAIHAAQHGDEAASLVLFREALAVAEQGGLGREARNLMNNIGAALRQQGDLDGAAEQLQRALEADATASDQSGVAGTLLNLSQVELQRGDAVAAIEAAEKALGVGVAQGLELLATYAREQLGSALAAHGAVDDALRHLREAVDGAHRLGHRLFETGMLNTLAETLLTADRVDEASSVFDAAADLANQIDNPFERARAHAGAGRISALRGDVVGARRAFQDALAGYDDDSPEAAAVRESLAALEEASRPHGRASTPSG